MSSVPELFDKILVTYIKMGDRECWQCSGRGRVRDPDTPEAIVTYGDDAVVHAWPLVRCEPCDGAGQIRGTPDHLGVLASMNAEVLRFACAARDASRFADMNAALDWGLSYIDALRDNILAEDDGPEMMRKFFSKALDTFVDVVNAPPQAEPSESQALTQDDLRKLGVIPESLDES